MFKLLIISLLSACASEPELPDESNDISALLAENQEELQLLLFIAPDDTRANELILAATVDSIDLQVHDVAFEPTLALQGGVSSNGYALLSRKPTAALMSPPHAMFPITGDLYGNVEAALSAMTTPQISAFFVSGEDGLVFDSLEPSNRNQRLATILRRRGVAVYFDAPRGIQDSGISDAPENNLFVLTGRPSTFPANVTSEIERHLINGGPLLVAFEPEADHGAFDAIGETLGLRIGNGTLVSEVGQVREDIGQASRQDRLNHATNAFLSHESNPHLSARTSSSAQLLLSTSSWLQPIGGSTSNFTPTVLSNDAAFGDLNGNTRLDEDETSGALVLAGVSVGGAGSPYRAAILADSTMISDRWLLHPTNGLFTKDLIRWLLPGSDDDIVTFSHDLEGVIPVAPRGTPLFTGERIQSIQLQDARRSVTAVIQRDNYGIFSTITSDTARGLESFRGSQEMDQFGALDYNINYLRRWEALSDEKLAEFGLEQSDRSLNIHLTSGRSYSFMLGARNNALGATYALDLNSNDVFLLRYDDYSPVAQPTRTLRDSRFHGELDWQLIQINIDGETLRIERRDESWVVAGVPADNTTVTEWAQEVFRLRTMPNEFEQESVEELLSFYITSNTGVINRVRLGSALSSSGESVSVGWSSHTRAWVVVPPRTGNLVAAAPTTLLQAIHQ